MAIVQTMTDLFHNNPTIVLNPKIPRVPTVIFWPRNPVLLFTFYFWQTLRINEFDSERFLAELTFADPLPSYEGKPENSRLAWPNPGCALRQQTKSPTRNWKANRGEKS